MTSLKHHAAQPDDISVIATASLQVTTAAAQPDFLARLPVGEFDDFFDSEDVVAGSPKPQHLAMLTNRCVLLYERRH